MLHIPLKIKIISSILFCQDRTLTHVTYCCFFVSDDLHKQPVRCFRLEDRLGKERHNQLEVICLSECSPHVLLCFFFTCLMLKDLPDSVEEVMDLFSPTPPINTRLSGCCVNTKTEKKTRIRTALAGSIVFRVCACVCVCASV